MVPDSFNNTFFQTAVHQCNDLVVITDSNALIIYVNPAFESHTGYTFAEIKGKNISIIKSGIHTTKFYKSLWQYLKKGEAYVAVFINKKKNGELFYENKTITPIKNAKGQIEYFLSTSKDITKEFNLRKEIVKQKDLVQTIIQNTDAVIVRLNTEGKILFVNQACLKTTGYKEKEVIGKSVFTLFIPPDKHKEIKALYELLLRGVSRAKKYESVWKAKSGKKIILSWSGTIIKDDTDGSTVILATGIDVTKERTNAEKLLQLNQSLDRKVFERTKALKKLNEEIILKNKFINKINADLPALIYLMDVRTKTLEMLNTNISNKIKLPVKRNETLSIKQFLKSFSTIEGEKIKEDDFRLNLAAKEYILLLDGKKYDVHNKTVVFEKDKKGNPKTILGFITDITQTKIIQNRLEESQKIAHVGNWEWNIKTNEIFWSQEIYRMFAMDQFKFKPTYSKFISQVYKDDRKLVEDTVARSLQNRSVYEVTHRLEPKNGKIKYVIEKGYTLYDKHGKPDKMIGTVQDITEEKLLKNKLQTAFFTLENSLNAVFTSDLKGNLQFANASAIKMWGYDDFESMVNERPAVPNYWSCSEKDRILKCIASILMHGTYSPTEPYTAVRRNGDKFLVKFNGALIRDEDGNAIGITGSFFDVTEEVRMKEEMEAYDHKLSLLLGNIDEVVYGVEPAAELDQKDKTFFLSGKAKELYGFDFQDTQSNPDIWQESIHPEDVENVRASNKEAIQEKKTVTREYRIKHRITGKYAWFEDKVTPQFDATGKLISYFGSSRDITEKKKTNDLLIENEKKYRLIYENALVGIYRAHIETKRAVDANDVAVKLFGYDSKEDFLENFVASERYSNPGSRTALIGELKEKRTIKNRQVEFVQKNGSVFWGNISMKLVSKDILEAVVIDITQSKVHQFELQKSILEKDLLLKEIHHRVKNNLQVISSLIKLQLSKIQDPHIREPLLESRERIHAIALIHEKLYLSEDISTLNFSEYLHNLTRPMKSLHKGKDISVSFSLEPFYTNINIAVPLGLMCYEIISNAFKHAFQEHSIGEIQISIITYNKNKVIIIKDNGCGFDIDKIDTSKSLGWNLITNLIKQTKAHLDIDSNIGAGSTFKIVFTNELR